MTSPRKLYTGIDRPVNVFQVKTADNASTEREQLNRILKELNRKIEQMTTVVSSTSGSALSGASAASTTSAADASVASRGPEGQKAPAEVAVTTPEDREIYTTTAITTSTSYDTYYCSGTFTVTCALINQQVTIKNIGTGTITVTTTVPATYQIDGSQTRTLTQWESLTLGFSSALSQFYIK